MRLFLHELRNQQLVFWRSKEAALFIFLFPLLLFVLLGSVYSGKIYGVPAPVALLAGLMAGLVDVTKQGLWSFYRLSPDLSAAARRILDAIG